MKIRSTTILAVRRDGKLAIAGDGQVTLDKTVMKHGARKVRKIAGGNVLAGFAGSAADGITLLEKFEAKFARVQGPAPRRGRAGQRLASRSRAAPSGSVADRRQSRPSLRALRYRRRDRTRRRHRGDRQRRPVRASRGDGAAAQHGAGRRRDRAQSAWRSRRRSASTPTTTSPWRAFRDEPAGDRSGSRASHARARSSPSSTSTSSAKARPSARSRSRCATATGAPARARICATKSRRRTF